MLCEVPGDIIKFWLLASLCTLLFISGVSVLAYTAINGLAGSLSILAIFICYTLGGSLPLLFVMAAVRVPELFFKLPEVKLCILEDCESS